jgi:hypothetical protein
MVVSKSMGLTHVSARVANPAASPVIFGEKDDAALLGTVSLESLGLVLDPMKRVLRPLPMVLGRLSAPWR